MLPSIGKGIFNSKDWIYEVKWDGYRTLAYSTSSLVELRSKNNKSYNYKFPSILNSLTSLGDCILDGEIIALDENGMHKPSLLRKAPRITNVIYMVYDILELKGRDLTNIPLIERKDILKNFLPKTNNILLVDYLLEKGRELFTNSIKNHFEGIVAKKADSIYQEGKTSDWLKFKNKIYCDAVNMKERIFNR